MLDVDVASFCELNGWIDDTERGKHPPLIMGLAERAAEAGFPYAKLLSEVNGGYNVGEPRV